MLFERGANLRQEMNSGGTVLRLRVDNFPVPHGTLHSQGVAVNVFPLETAKFSERETSPRGNHNRASCQAVHRVCNLLDFRQRVLVRFPSSLTFWNLDAVCRVRTLKRSAPSSVGEDCRQ